MLGWSLSLPSFKKSQLMKVGREALLRVRKHALTRCVSVTTVIDLGLEDTILALQMSSPVKTFIVFCSVCGMTCQLGMVILHFYLYPKT